MIESDVVIVGGGPVGLFLACELGSYGVPCMVLNEGAGVTQHPRANTHSARSMELYRRHGIAAEFRRFGLPPDHPTDSAYFTRLAAHELGRIPLPSLRRAMLAALASHERWPTPEPQFRCTQVALEPLLKRRAESFATNSIQFGYRAIAVEEAADGVRVTAEATTGGPALTVKARYGVGCDGARSIVRRAMDVRYEGEGGINLNFFGGQMVATHFRARHLLSVIDKPPAWQYWSIVPEQRSIVLALDGKQDFLLHVQLPADRTPERFDFAATLRRTVGAEIEHEIISSVPWRGGQALVAERYATARLVIAGDAAHLFTPTGGFGVNTGIEDAANLAWKLAGVCHGWAPDALLATYQAERKPIAHRNTSAALALAKAGGQCPIVPELEMDSAEGVAARFALFQHIAGYAWGEFDAAGIQLGARYDGSPLIIGDGVPPPDSPIHFVQSGVPGGRAPHLWIAEGRSLLDLLAHRFTLLEFGDGASAGRIEGPSARRRLPLARIAVNSPRARELYGADLVLVRPDQHIAWRGDRLPDDVDRLLDRVVGGAPGMVAA